MNTYSLSLRAVLRRTFGIYLHQAHVLLGAALIVEALVALDQAQSGHDLALALVVLLFNFAGLGMFVCMIVLLVADISDSGHPRSIRELLRSAWSALGSLLLVGFLAAITITLLASVAPVLFAVILGIVVFHAGLGMLVLVGLIAVPLLVVVPELFLLTIWSVLAAVAVLERPGGLRAFGRSRELVRGSGGRVLTLILTLALPLVVVDGAVQRAAHAAGGEPALAARLILTTLIAPIPVLAASVLYFELLRAELTPASSLEPLSQ